MTRESVPCSIWNRWRSDSACNCHAHRYSSSTIRFFKTGQYINEMLVLQVTPGSTKPRIVRDLGMRSCHMPDAAIRMQ